MKTKLFALMLLSAMALGAITSCSDETFTPVNPPEGNTPMEMTLITETQEAALRLVGTKTATINWGDGSRNETHDISGDWQVFQHSYSDKSSHTITITGVNITTLMCYYNQLISLDVSNNTALSSLDCYGNQLTSLDMSGNTALINFDCGNNLLSNSALNKLFETLHDNTLGRTKTIRIFDNPGTNTCNPNIAQARGWVVNTTEL